MIRKHGIRQTLTMICAVAMMTAGCHSATNAGTTSSGGMDGAAGSGGTQAKAPTYVGSGALSTQTTTATVTDPTLNNMVSATLTIPAGWKLQGITMVSPCNSVPWPVFRSYSSDGLMQMRYEPVFGWKWSKAKGVNMSGCAPLSGTMSAAQFLQYYVGTMQGGVHVVGTMPISATYSQWAQGLATQSNQITSRSAPALQTQSTADTAALRIEVVNGTFVVEERLRTIVLCSVSKNVSPMSGGMCWARVDILTAPQGQLDALVQLVDSKNLPGGTFAPAWGQAFMQRQQAQGNAMLAQLAVQEKQESQMIYQQFQQIMQRSASEHAAFMQQQESQFQSAMSNANASMNAQSTAASDWVDYALDQQTVSGAGGTVKVSSAYSQTWSNGAGQWYQTNDPNSNPNGVLSGTWTQDTKVHGNGQPQ